MRRAPGPSVDLSVYPRALLVLLRTPTIIVVPLLMSVAVALVGRLLAPSAGSVAGDMTSGLAFILLIVLQMFGVGAACIIADEAWRHGRASFDRGWEEAGRRSGDIIMAAIGFSLLLGVAQFIGGILGPFALALLVLIAFFLMWSLPAAAIGGVPGGAAIQVSIDRVRANGLSAALTFIVSAAALYGLALLLPAYLLVLLPRGASVIAGTLIVALCQSIALGYVATILTKTYIDASFGGRRW